jgi:hypothetical protein
MKAVGSEVYALEAERMSINGDHYSQIAILITTTLSMERGFLFFAASITTNIPPKNCLSKEI